MNIIIPVILFIPFIMFLAIGYSIKVQKAYWLISGYNTMSAEKKKNVNTEVLGKAVGNLCFFLAAIIAVSAVLMMAGLTMAGGIVIALIFPSIIYTLIRIQKFDGNNYNTNGKMKTGSKVVVSLSVALVVIIMAGVAVIMAFSAKPAEYTIEDGVLNISGMYGEKIPLNTIRSLDMREDLPKVLIRTNGSALGDKLKGNFKLEGLEKAKLFIDRDKPPFIYLETDSGIILLNCDKSEETGALYTTLREAWEKTQ